MEARAILQKIRQRGFVIKAVGNAISLAPKQRINDRMIIFIRDHKEKLLTALYQEQDEIRASHVKRKRSLRQGRIEVLRLLLQRLLKNPVCRAMIGYKGGAVTNDQAQAVVAYLDGELANFDYDLEAIIDLYQVYTPKQEPTRFTCDKCGYRPLFCSCTEA